MQWLSPMNTSGAVGAIQSCVTAGATNAVGRAPRAAHTGHGDVTESVLLQNLTVSMIDSGFWLQLPKDLVHAVLGALGCDSFNPSSDSDASDALHLFPEKGAGKTAMTISVRSGRLERQFWTGGRRASAALPADGAEESVLQFLPKGAANSAGVRSAGLSGGWRGVSIAHVCRSPHCRCTLSMRECRLCSLSSIHAYMHVQLLVLKPGHRGIGQLVRGVRLGTLHGSCVYVDHKGHIFTVWCAHTACAKRRKSCRELTSFAGHSACNMCQCCGIDHRAHKPLPAFDCLRFHAC